MVLNAISFPLAVVFPLLVLLDTTFLPLSAVITRTCHRQTCTHVEGNEPTLHGSSECSVIHHQPTHNTWQPVHSSNGRSEDTPFTKHYGSNVVVVWLLYCWLRHADLEDEIGGIAEVREEGIAMWTVWGSSSVLVSFAYTVSCN